MDRPKWMPDETVILEIQDGEYIDGEVDDAFRRTGLRAQIAVLEEMVELFKIRSCPCGLQILAKIAALRKELEG